MPDFYRTRPDVMRRKPRPPKESIFAGGMGRHIIWVSILLAAIPHWGLTDSAANNWRPSRMRKLCWTTGILCLRKSGRAEILLEGENASRGSEEGSEGIIAEAERIPRTIAFTVLALGQIFHVIAIHGGDRALFFTVWFKKNPLLFWAALSTFILQLAVIYVPFLQAIFETKPLPVETMLAAVALSSAILFAVEIKKFFRRHNPTVAAT